MLRLVAISVVLSAIIGDQRNMVGAVPHRFINNQPMAENRRYHWIKDLKKQERLKIKHLKKHFRKCGISHPFKFKWFRRSDNDDLDTIHVMVPYGFSDEYLPEPQFAYSPSTTPRFVYSVKYRETPSSNSTNLELLS